MAENEKILETLRDCLSPKLTDFLETRREDEIMFAIFRWTDGRTYQLTIKEVLDGQGRADQEGPRPSYRYR
jgi:hypothetical protein